MTRNGMQNYIKNINKHDKVHTNTKNAMVLEKTSSKRNRENSAMSLESLNAVVNVEEGH